MPSDDNRGPVGLRVDLLRRGLWERFYQRVDELQSKDRLNTAEAWRVAESEFSGMLTSEKPGASAEESSPGATSGELSDQTISAGDNSASEVPVAEKTKPLALVARRHFDGKPPSSYVSDCDWASQNFAVLDVTVDDAPSARAWWLMMQARESPQVMREIMTVLARNYADNDEEAEIQRDLRRSERELLDTIDRIEKAAAEV
jgi:hypothetical protein